MTITGHRVGAEAKALTSLSTEAQRMRRMRKGTGLDQGQRSLADAQAKPPRA